VVNPGLFLAENFQIIYSVSVFGTKSCFTDMSAS